MRMASFPLYDLQKSLNSNTDQSDKGESVLQSAAAEHDTSGHAPNYLALFLVLSTN